MATNGHSGYPLKWFKDQNSARSSFECAICLEVLKHPVQVRDCGHQFCALCIDDILKTDPRCPSCRIRISKAMVFEDHAARRLINKMDVNCCNEGCSWIGSLSSLLEELEARLESLVLKVSTLENMHKNDMKEVNFKHENDLREIKIKHEKDLREIKTEHENDLRKLNSQHDEEVKRLRDQISFFGRYTPLPKTADQSLEQLNRNLTVTTTFKIPNFTRKLNQAKSNNEYGEIFGDPFYSYHGYKMKIRVRLNEAPCGNTGYMGVYLHVMKGDHDDKLKWPFDKKITFIVVDQQNDEAQVDNHERILVTESILGFSRFLSGDTIHGISRFVLHSTLRTRQYVRNHGVYIAVAIQP